MYVCMYSHRRAHPHNPAAIPRPEVNKINHMDMMVTDKQFALISHSQKSHRDAHDRMVSTPSPRPAASLAGVASAPS